MSLTVIQKIRLKIFGYSFLFKENGLDYYVIRCKKHGLQITYPQGYSEILHCKECLLEEKTRSNGSGLLPTAWKLVQRYAGLKSVKRLQNFVAGRPRRLRDLSWDKDTQ